MRIFVYEFVSGGGLLAGGPDGSVPDSLLREGMAMLSAVLADLGAIPGVRVAVMRDVRLMESWRDVAANGAQIHDAAKSAEEQTTFDELAGSADRTLVIAPEIGGALLARCRRVEQLGGRLLGPSSKVVALAADKQLTAEWLTAANVPAPRGCAIEAGQRLPVNFPYPAVLKPRDGAGSQDVRYVKHTPSRSSTETLRFAARLEQFCPGTPVSVALLCGPQQQVALPACRQCLSQDGEFRYLGGDGPLEPHLAERASALASRAVATLPEPRGYLGVDLILGDSLDGRNDVVIEINPRLTTSYVGLRRLAQQNLAVAMLAILDGEETSLSFRPGRVQFEADGTVTFCE